MPMKVAEREWKKMLKQLIIIETAQNVKAHLRGVSTMLRLRFVPPLPHIPVDYLKTIVGSSPDTNARSIHPLLTLHRHRA